MIEGVDIAVRYSIFGYLIGEGFRNVFKNKKSTIASLVIMCATMFVFGIFFAVSQNVNHITKTIEEQQGMEVFILDEATAFADPENEYLIQSAINNLIKGKTLIVVAHRLSTIKNADEIAVVSDGKIVEQGTHDELVKKGGEYYKLYAAQKNKYDL